MIKQPLHASVVPAQKVGSDLLSRLYREIGISAVAAALNVAETKEPVIAPARTPAIPAGAVHAIRP